MGYRNHNPKRKAFYDAVYGEAPELDAKRANEAAWHRAEAVAWERGERDETSGEVARIKAEADRVDLGDEGATGEAEPGCGADELFSRYRRFFETVAKRSLDDADPKAEIAARIAFMAGAFEAMDCVVGNKLPMTAIHRGAVDLFSEASKDFTRMSGKGGGSDA